MTFTGPISPKSRMSTVTIIPEIGKRVSLLSVNRPSIDQRSRPPGERFSALPSMNPRLSVISEMSVVADEPGEANEAESLPERKAAVHRLETVSNSLERICQDRERLVSGMPSLRHRLSQIPQLIQDTEDTINDPFMKKEVVTIQNTLDRIDETVRRARRSWFWRRKKFEEPIRSLTEDLADAFARVRISAVQVRSSLPMRLRQSTTIVSPCDEGRQLSNAEITCLTGDRYFFGIHSRCLGLADTDEGHGVTKCLATAKIYYEAAATAGYAPAMNNLGTLFRFGIGVSVDSAQALDLYQKAADLGCVDSVNNLAEMQATMAETAHDLAYAFELFEIAANADHLEAATTLVRTASVNDVVADGWSDQGWLHQTGDAKFNLVPKNIDVAEKWLGNPQLYLTALQRVLGIGIGSLHRMDTQKRSSYQNNLGHLLYGRAINGQGNPSQWDSRQLQFWLEEAITAFQLSVTQGNPSAMSNLGICYELGNGVPKDQVQAERLYQQAADLGHLNACANAGRLLFSRGRYCDARRILLKAVSDDDAKSCSAAYVGLGQIYEKGIGVKGCPVTAFEYYERAAKLGNAQGQFLAAIFLYRGLGVRQNLQRAFDMNKASAVQGYADGQNALGLMLEEGVPFVQDFQQALFWFKSAADKNHPDAICNLARMHENGTGLPKADFKEAVLLYEKANSLGSFEAAKRLVDLEENNMALRK